MFTRRKISRLLLALPFVSTVLKSAAALAAWNEAAFTATRQKDALEKFFPGRTITASDEITLGVHDLVENGAVVPVQIESSLDGVKSISIFVEYNPNPLVAHFEMAPGCRAFIATRIKVGAPSSIMAVVDTGDGLYSSSKHVEVVEGGCG